ncbi:hypothetical protein B2J88_02935 [Rhodococcus sp. SRB_17]|nr:hypothetical protein [Rhodococcus sp. SRB_17]
MLELLSGLVVPLGRSLPTGTEVVLHDLGVVPHSIVAIYGTLTGRKVGDNSNAITLERITDITDDDQVSYESVLADGRTIRTTTITVRDATGTPIAALGINVDLTPWKSIQRIAESIVGGHRPIDLAAPPMFDSGSDSQLDGSDDFIGNLEDLAQVMIEREIAAVGVPLKSMKKGHKVEIVRRLRERGVFLLRDSVVQVAEALDVSRFTIYNYTNEIEALEAE